MSVEVVVPLTVATIEELEGRRIEALLHADGRALVKLQHDHGRVVHSSGFVDEMPSYARALASRVFEYHSLTTSDRGIEIIGDLAVTVYRQDADMTVRGNRQATSVRCSAVWSIKDGRAGLSLVQSTRLSS